MLLDYLAKTLRGERSLGLTYPYKSIGWIDFETRGRVPIEAGAYRYARNADGIMLAWAIGDGEVQTTTAFSAGPRRLPGARLDMVDLPTEILAHHAKVLNGTGIWCAWNAGFDRQIWNQSCDGFPPMQPHHIIDAMAQATASGLPPDLAMAAKYCGGAQKDKTGSELIKLFCLPTSTATPQSHPQEWLQFAFYAQSDIASMRHVFKCVRQLSKAEWHEYWAMEAINDRGVGVDLALAANAAILAKEDRTRSRAELTALTGGAVTAVDQIKRMSAWLLTQLPGAGREILTKRAEEIGEDGELVRPAKMSLTRPRVERLITLCQDKPELATAERVLQIRLYGGSKTPTKFAKLLEQNVDGMLHGQYVFNGAPQTGRASSRGVQVHNLARDPLPYEADALDAILGGCTYERLAQLGNDDPVSRKLSLLIRPTFIPGDDRVFVWSDWSQIEARILPWLAKSDGGDRRLQVFKDVDADPTLPDLYTRTASDISHIPVHAVTKALRQRGKVAELALGFGGGIGALHAMGAGYGLFLTDDEAKQIVGAWRAANQWCVNFWGRHDAHGSYGLWGQAQQAMMSPGAWFPAGRVWFVYLKEYFNGSLLCMLPSGRFLIYRDIRDEPVDDLDEDGKPTGHQTNHLRYARGYGRGKIWHGTFCENVVQACAADFLRGTLRRLEEDTWLTTRLHTHDEILVECERGEADEVSAILRAHMLRGFAWSDGLPLQSEETVGYYYTKNEGSHGL